MKRQTRAGIEVVEAEHTARDLDSTLLAEVGVRSQRLSDAYPVRQRIFEPRLAIHRGYSHYSSKLVDVLVNFLFPRVLHHSGILGAFFSRTTAVRLLCPHTCADGHICTFYEGHRGDHLCSFGHRNRDAIPHCGHGCDCRGCEADCAFGPGHLGPHKCTFNHSWSDIPGSRNDIIRFRLDKAIGDYVDELAYASPEEIRYAHIPETLSPDDEQWTIDGPEQPQSKPNAFPAPGSDSPASVDNDDEIALLRRLLNDLEDIQGPLDV